MIRGAVFAIKVKNGCNALRIATSTEREVVFPRHSATNRIGFKVISITPKDPITRYPKEVSMEVVYGV